MPDQSTALAHRYPISCRAIDCWSDWPPGWESLIRRCVGDLERLAEKQAETGCEPVQVHQIKEKFGMLTIYLTGEGGYQMLEPYVEESKRTCMTCGAPGEGRKRGSWLYVSCEEHVR